MHDSLREIAEKKSQATTVIAKCFRGHKVRRSYLPFNLYSVYRAQCDKANSPEGYLIPKAEGGHTKVYLPNELPYLVLKKTGRSHALMRLRQMQTVRTILDLQKSSHLIVPRANLCQNFTVEERLPIDINYCYNMGLYTCQPRLFDDAVRELIRLFSKIHINDLVNKYDIVRYDNLPMYIVEKNGRKEGRVGLIDLERLQEAPSTRGMSTVARIFPLHLDIIKDEASKLNVELDENSLNDATEKGKRCLQVEFSDHLEWLKQKGLYNKNSSSQAFEITPESIEKLTNCVEEELLKLNQGINECFEKIEHKISLRPFSYQVKPQRNFLTKELAKTAKDLSIIFLPLMLNNIKKQIERQQNKTLARIVDCNLTDAELIKIRSPIISRNELVNEIYKKMCELMHQDKIKFNYPDYIPEQHILRLVIERLDIKIIALRLIYIVLRELSDDKGLRFDHECLGDCVIKY